MPTYIKDSNIQRLVRYAFVKDSGVWKRCKRIWIKDAGVWRKAYEIEAPPAAESYTTTGTNISWTKPSGYFDYMTVQIWGAGGGGETGSNDTSAGGGGGGAYIKFDISYANAPASGTIFVGAGGIAVNIDNRQGGDGGNTSFLGATAGGGGGGGVLGNAQAGLGGVIVSPPSGVTYYGYITENGGQGGPGTNAVQPAGNGQSRTYAGAGGGGGGETTGAQGGAGGTSTFGGNGGTGGGGNTGSPQPTAGSAPGGGGGGDDGFGKDGARGEVRITYYTTLS